MEAGRVLLLQQQLVAAVQGAVRLTVLLPAGGAVQAAIVARQLGSVCSSWSYKACQQYSSHLLLLLLLVLMEIMAS
jgi:hypothetical protein